MVLHQPDLGGADALTDALGGASAATVLVAVDARTPDASGAEHLVHRLELALADVERDGYVASTHVVHVDGRTRRSRRAGRSWHRG